MGRTYEGLTLSLLPSTEDLVVVKALVVCQLQREEESVATPPLACLLCVELLTSGEFVLEVDLKHELVLQIHIIVRPPLLSPSAHQASQQLTFSKSVSILSCSSSFFGGFSSPSSWSRARVSTISWYCFGMTELTRSRSTTGIPVRTATCVAVWLGLALVVEVGDIGDVAEVGGLDVEDAGRIVEPSVVVMIDSVELAAETGLRGFEVRELGEDGLPTTCVGREAEREEEDVLSVEGVKTDWGGGGSSTRRIETRWTISFEGILDHLR